MVEGASLFGVDDVAGASPTADAIALHEAGHAVVALDEGFEVARLSLECDSAVSRKCVMSHEPKARIVPTLLFRARS